jgi:hypothetical protein
LGQSPKPFGGEGGKKVIPTEIGTYARSQNICPVHLIRAVAAPLCLGAHTRRHSAVATSEKTSSQKEE